MALACPVGKPCTRSKRSGYAKSRSCQAKDTAQCARSRGKTPAQVQMEPARVQTGPAQVHTQPAQVQTGPTRTNVHSWFLFHLLRYIMTSEFTLAPTEDFFKRNHYFGLEPSNIIMFEQRMVPAVSLQGKVFLQDKGKVAMAPGAFLLFASETFLAVIPNICIFHQTETEVCTRLWWTTGSCRTWRGGGLSMCTSTAWTTSWSRWPTPSSSASA